LPAIFPPFRYFLKYLFANHTSRKLKITTPANENQADFFFQSVVDFAFQLSTLAPCSPAGKTLVTLSAAADLAHYSSTTHAIRDTRYEL